MVMIMLEEEYHSFSFLDRHQQSPIISCMRYCVAFGLGGMEAEECREFSRLKRNIWLVG